MTTTADIMAHIDSLPQGSVAFDFDGTLCYNDLAEALLFWMCQHGEIRNTHWKSGKEIIEYYFSKNYTNDYIELCILCGQVFVGYSIKEIQHIIDRVVAEEGTELTQQTVFGHTVAKGLGVRQSAQQILNHCIQQGRDVHIVSASPQFEVEYIAQKYFQATVHGVRFNTDQGRIAHTTIAPEPINQGKVEALKQLNKTFVFAMGNSTHDFPMIEYCGSGAVYASKNLQEQVKQKGWFVLED